MELEGAVGIDAPVEEAVPLMAEGDIVPQLQDFATVGHLYRSIEHGIAHLAEKFGERGLFVGPPARRRRRRTSVGRSSSPSPTSSRHSGRSTRSSSKGRARAATGNPRISASSSRFWTSTAAARPKSGLRPGAPGAVRDRPLGRARRGDPLIGDEVTARRTDLFNVGYEILLQTFERYFAHTEETDAQLRPWPRRRSR